ncbi:MAG: phage tail protein [Chloroflexi bacterium]|nr:phage tail protein [Chloroflexota bacterium]
MTDSTTTSGSQIDSLRQNEFEVQLEGQRVSGIFTVSGLVPFKLDMSASQPVLKQKPIVLTKLVQRDPTLPFNAWLRETVAAGAGAKRPTRTLAIVVLDDGIETRRWTLNDAWISQIAYSDFSTANVELVEETITLHYESITEVWLGRP